MTPKESLTTGDSPRSRPLWCSLTLALAVFTAAAPASLQESRPNASSDSGSAGEAEAKIKVAYIYNFLKFIEWPTSETRTARDSFSICLLGIDPMRTMLGELSVRTVKNRPIRVAQVKDLKSLASCHILYVSRSEEHSVAQTLRDVGNAPVLSVSDIHEFTAKGGMIGFVTEAGHVKLQVNLPLLRRAGLRVSAKLLEVARIVP